MIAPLNRRGTWRTYSMVDGLAGMRIAHIAEDSEGYLWFASWDNGVSRFDGDEFHNFTKQDGLVDDSVYFVLPDSRDRLWFGTLNGVCWYDGTNFHHLEDDGIAGRGVQFIYEDREGRIWCGGYRTLGYYDGSVFHDLMPLYLKPYEPLSFKLCRGITQDPEGHLWFGFDYLIRFDGTSFYRYEEKEGFPQNMSYALGQDDAGRVWIGHHGQQNRLWCYTDGTFQTVQVNLGGVLRKIQCDREGRMWFNTSEGVLYQDGDGFSRFTSADGLPHRAVKAVFQDRDHQFWFATWGGVGLYNTQISVFDLSAEDSKNTSKISQIVQDSRGDIWIGYGDPLLQLQPQSVFRFNGEVFTPVSTVDGVNINNCFAIYEDRDGYVWFGGINSLFRYDGKKLKKMQPIAGLGERSVSAITQDLQGRFIFGCWEKSNITRKKDLFASPLELIYQQGEQFQAIFVKEDKGPFSRIGTVIPGRDGEIYFHLVHQNFSENDKGFAHWHSKDKLKLYGIEDGLIDNRVNDLILDRNGNLWIATLGGLACFDGSTFRTFTTEDDLPSNRIRCLFEDRQGHLWLGTDGGIAHYDGQYFQTFKSPHIGPVLQILEDHDGFFWFGTDRGALVRYRQRQTPPLIRLQQVIADKVYENPQDVIVSITDQQVTFEYKGMSFSTHPHDMLYVYRLMGYDSDWQLAMREMRAYYRGLPPGDYTFQVRAIDRDLNYSEIAQVQISVELDPRIEALTTPLNSLRDNEFIGQSKALQQFQSKLIEVASTDMTVLLLGETGVGKGLAARILHEHSAHSDGPFIQVNCGALPETLIDSELFGHEKGAFTSAVSRRLGKIELAKDGTLFLDEVGDMTPGTQARMLRVLEEGTFERVGGTQTLKAQTRIMAATNRDLKDMVNEGDFREDLYYRLNAFPMYLPPLRERKEDIPGLAEFFKSRMVTRLDKQIGALTPDIIEALQAYDWPGNVRELEHLIQRTVIVCRGSQIKLEDLGLYHSQIKGVVPEGKKTIFGQDREVVPLDEYDRRYILDVLKATKWRISGPQGAAVLLGLPPSTLYGKMRKLGSNVPNSVIKHS